MADLDQDYFLKKIEKPSYTITLKFFVIGHEDQLGTFDFWKDVFDQLYRQMPFPKFWDGMVVEFWHMSRDFPKGITLKDYKPNVPGFQVAHGLHFADNKIMIGVFPDGWNKNSKTNPTVIKMTNIFDSVGTLSHEVGHYADHKCGYQKIKKLVPRFITESFDELAPGQGHNPVEDFAETYKATKGSDMARGVFSDDKPYVAPNKMMTLMGLCYWMAKNVSKRFAVRNIVLHEKYIAWTQGIWFWAKRKAVTRAYEEFTLVKGKWKIDR